MTDSPHQRETWEHRITDERVQVVGVAKRHNDTGRNVVVRDDLAQLATIPFGRFVREWRIVEDAN